MNVQHRLLPHADNQEETYGRINVVHPKMKNMIIEGLRSKVG